MAITEINEALVPLPLSKIWTGEETKMENIEWLKDRIIEGIN